MAETQATIAADAEIAAVTLRPPQWPGKINVYRRRELDDADVNEVIWLWDQGLDTWQIHKISGHSQAACERALHVGLEKRHQQAQAEKGSREEDSREDGEEDQGRS